MKRVLAAFAMLSLITATPAAFSAQTQVKGCFPHDAPVPCPKK